MIKVEVEKINLIDGLAIIAIGVGFIVGVLTGQENIALTCIGALSGYIGAVYNSASKNGNSSSSDNNISSHNNNSNNNVISRYSDSNNDTLINDHDNNNNGNSINNDTNKVN